MPAWPCGLLLLLLLTPPSAAQDAPALERGALRLRANVAHHEALFVAQGVPRLREGWTADDQALSLLLFGEGPLGGSLQLERTVILFSPLGEDGAEVDFLEALVRGHLALAARGMVGPVLLGTRLGYAFAQLPLGLPERSLPPTGWRHAVLLAPHVRVPLPWALQLEASGELWLPLRATGRQRRPLDSRGGALGLALGRQMGQAGALTWNLWLDARLSRDDSAQAVGEAAYHRVTRVGLITELTWGAGGAPTSPPSPE